MTDMNGNQHSRKENLKKRRNKAINKAIDKTIIFKNFKKRYVAVLLFLGVAIITLIGIGISSSVIMQKQMQEYERYFYTDEKKEHITMEVYNSKENDAAMPQKGLKCLEQSIDVENIPDSIQSVIDEINNYYNASGGRYSFKYTDIYTGFSVSYNENGKIPTASTIKAPTDIYIYEQASEGKVDLSENILYTSKYYNPGAGFIKLGETNKNYTIKELVFNSAFYSDNIAHTMLMDRFKRENLLDFWSAKGTTALYARKGTIWGDTSAHDATIYIRELYDFYQTDNEYASELMGYFLDNAAKFFPEMEGVQIASKSGCAGSSMHDVAIVFDENPYTMVALSSLGCLNAGDYFSTVSDMTYRLHKAYWQYKIDSCL